MRRGLLSIIAACVAVPCDGAEAGPPARASLIGTWVEEPGTCAGDSGTIYRPDGRFSGYDYEGRWTLTEARLTEVVTKRMGSDEIWRRVKSPEKSSSTIMALQGEKMTQRWSDGSIHRLHRCR